MEKISGIENALLLDLEEARAVFEYGRKLVLCGGRIEKWSASGGLSAVLGSELRVAGYSDSGSYLLVTEEVKQVLEKELKARREAAVARSKAEGRVFVDLDSARSVVFGRIPGGVEDDEAGVSNGRSDANDVVDVDNVLGAVNVYNGDKWVGHSMAILA